ncbi:MAG TPA: zinc-dependent peptidase [Polyangiales bacterium]|jgi:Mlc titration factor MtfA (ptsG expression regulator)|nr:zinc-dependent peptidase [Polyangiales bacterium]
MNASHAAPLPVEWHAIFAVASEVYFERPRDLEAALPDLFFLLEQFYGSTR